jgi:hypothetical protein
MPGPKPPEIKLTDAEREGLEKLVRSRTAEHQKVLRGQIVLLAAAEKNTPEIAKALNISLDMTRLWRRRWIDLQPIGLGELSVEERLEDLPRPGAPVQITADQICQIEKMACEKPENLADRSANGQGEKLLTKLCSGGFWQAFHLAMQPDGLKKGSQAAFDPLLADAGQRER